jgi:general secretion pathway protein G
MPRSPRRAGFSLLELLAVIVLIGILAAVVIQRILVGLPGVKEDACARNKAEVNRVIERYYFDNGTWPADIAELGALPDFPDGVPNCPVSGNPYSFDPVTHRIAGHTSGSH